MAIEMGKAQEITNCVFNLFRKYGESDYIGEPVSQREHMIQCAMLAEKEGYTDAIVLGALFHDIGHLIGLDKSLPSMGDGIGTENHEVVGEQFLKEQGFGQNVYSFARGHVDAKRYLVFKHSDYYNKLSPTSKETLIHQGGPMEKEEAEQFEKLPNFEVLLKMRLWDELAKDPNATVECLQKYHHMCEKYLKNIGV